MIALRVLVAVAGVIGVVAVLGSVIRTVVLPRAIPARLARVAFLVVRNLLLARLRISRRSDYRTRDRVFALQAPLGLFAQLIIWTALTYLSFAGLFWGLSDAKLNGRGISGAFELAGSSMATLGFDKPSGIVLQLLSFASAAVGLTLLALVITYLPSLYGAFARREALITKLTVRTGRSPSGPSLLTHSWRLERFDVLDNEVWEAWEDWFIDLGESHTTFPQLGFFRSPHPDSHWVLAAESILDAIALLHSACDVQRQSRSELCLQAGVNALAAIADFLGIPHEPPEEETEIVLSPEQFNAARDQLGSLGVPLVADQDASWHEFRRTRARYEPLIAVLGRMTDAPRGEWSSWSDDLPRHSPPLLRLRRRHITSPSERD